MSEPKPKFQKKDVPLDQGPLAIASGAWDNLTNGQGVSGLVSQDGTAVGAVNEGVGLALRPTAGGSPPAVSVTQGPGKPAVADTDNGWAPDKVDPGTPGDFGADDAGALKVAKDLNFERPLGPAGGAAAWFRNQGYSYAPVGGEEAYKKAFVDDPAASDTAQRDLASTKAQHSSAVADFYKAQTERDTQAAADIKQRTLEDQQNMAARQQKLDEATQFYTNDLQDQGKFWTNPGNIVSAIAFSMMPIFSNDPTIGAKLINQAIDRDMANRQHAAQGTLGALQSNLAGYHKIAGDRQAGDLLARAEAHRIAAQEIARIGAQFEGPLAQKQMAANIADQMQRRDVAQMEFYKQNVHVDAKQMDPRLHAASYQGPGGYKKGIPLGGAPTDSQADASGTSHLGTIQGTPTTADTSGKLTPTTKAIINAGGLNGVAKGQKAGVVKQDELEESVRSAIMAKAISQGLNPDKYFETKMGEARKELAPFSAAISANAGARVMTANLMTKMAIIEKLEKENGKDPSSFISWSEKNLPRSAVTQYRQIFGTDPSQAKNRSEEFAAWRQTQVQALERQLAGVINLHIRELSGGAVSDQEKGRVDVEISPQSSWRDQVGFLNDKSKQLQAFVDAQSGALSPVAMIYYRHASNGGKFNNLLRPGQPGPAQAQAEPLTGQMSAPMSVQPPEGPNMSQGPIGAQR